WSNTTGSGNVALGFRSLSENTGSDNIAIGNQANAESTEGSQNIVIGTNATSYNGTLNTIIGYGAFPLSAGTTHSVAIGANAIVNCNNCLALGGNTATSRTKIGINNSTP